MVQVIPSNGPLSTRVNHLMDVIKIGIIPLHGHAMLTFFIKKKKKKKPSSPWAQGKFHVLCGSYLASNSSPLTFQYILPLTILISLSKFPLIYSFQFFTFSITKKQAFKTLSWKQTDNKKERKMPEKEGSCVGLNEPRLVVRKFLARPQPEGVGAVVRRSIGR